MFLALVIDAALRQRPKRFTMIKVPPQHQLTLRHVGQIRALKAASTEQVAHQNGTEGKWTALMVLNDSGCWISERARSENGLRI
jgi:hypothetical protein